VDVAEFGPALLGRLDVPLEGIGQVAALLSPLDSPSPCEHQKPAWEQIGAKSDHSWGQFPSAKEQRVVVENEIFQEF
jgi:hypothetical protein